jgi:hypothetical protein
MKKLIQLCSILSLIVVFSIVSANAQTVKQYAAEIPYDFNIGQKSHRAGSYIIKVSKLSTSVVSLSLQDKNENNLQTIIVRENGNTAKREPKLVFTSYDSHRFLTGMSMQEMGLSIVVSKETKLSVKAQGRPESKRQERSRAE